MGRNPGVAILAVETLQDIAQRPISPEFSTTYKIPTLQPFGRSQHHKINALFR